jgi:hypothetical protein
MVKNLDQNLPFILHQAFGLAQQFGVPQMVKIQGVSSRSHLRYHGGF